MLIRGPKKKFWAVQPVWGKASGAPYAGPGDSATFGQWASPAFGYSAAYASPGTNPCMDLVDQAGGNPITIVILANGKSDVASINAWVTAHSVTTIKVSKLYDQVGTAHLTQATLSKMPVLNLTGINSLPVLQASSANSTIMTSNNPAQAQPFTMLAVAERTANFTTNQDIYSNSTGTGGDLEFQYFNSANTVGAWSGAQFQTTASDSAAHVIQIGFNNGGSPAGTLNVDGAAQVTGSSGSNIGTSTIGANGMAIFAFPSGALYMDGYIGEVGFYAGTYNSGVQANARTRWGL